jgi:predicted enzyme related to lactoylglutathione lyase
MNIGYLEFVTPNVDKFCATYAKVHSVTFSEPVPELGNARTAPLAAGGKIGVRGPMRPDEKPVVRPYLKTNDINAAVEAAKTAGAELAFPPTEISGHGTFAIFLHDGIESALWQK